MSPARNDPCPCGSGKKYKKCCGAPGGRAAAGGGGEPPGAAAELAASLERAENAEREGRLAEAESAYRRVLEGRPDHARAAFRLGAVHARHRNEAAGLDMMRAALRAAPADSAMHFELANAYYERQRFDDAVAALDAAGGALPAEASILRAACLERLGRADDARAALRDAERTAPDHAYAAVIRARLERQAGGLEDAERRLAELLARPGVEPGVRVMAHHERGAVLDRLNRAPAAFEAFAAAGRERAALPDAQAIDRGFFPHRIERYRTGMTADLIARFAQETYDDGRRPPAFLVGFPRSGTTLTEQVVAAHPDAVTSDEADLLGPVRLELGTNVAGDEDPPARLRHLDRPRVERLRARYWAQVDARVPDLGPDRLFLDKYPLNLVDLGLINAIFPDARVLVALRDPRDVCLSCFMQDFGLNEAMVHFLDFGDTLRFYASVMDLWLHLRPMLSLSFLEVRYEDTVSDLPASAARILDALGLPWTDDVLRFHERAQTRTISTPSYAAVREPVHRRAVNRWERYAEAFGNAPVSLDRFVEAFGYGSE